MELVSIRRATVADAPFVHAIRSEPSAGAFQPILATPLAAIERQIAERARFPLAPHAAGKLQWTIFAGETPVGAITLTITEEDRRHHKGAIGYTIGEAHRGRGYGRAGLAALIPIAFDPNGLALERLEAIAAMENVASRRVLEANGFRQEGELRGLLIIGGRRVDHAAYGLLRTDLEER